jgi:hypothetical protein
VWSVWGFGGASWKKLEFWMALMALVSVSWVFLERFEDVLLFEFLDDRLGLFDVVGRQTNESVLKGGLLAGVKGFSVHSNACVHNRRF